MPRIVKTVLFLAPLLVLLGETGCSKPAMDTKTVAMHRTRLSLAEEPDGIQTVSDVRATLLGNGHDDHGHDDHGNDANGDHDHDGDGHADHEAAGHDSDEGHDHDGDGQTDHVAADHDADQHEHDEEEHAGHDDDHSDGHSDDNTAAHDHDGDGHPDHAADQHVHATESQVVSIVGHIGGLSNPWANVHKEYPFAKSQAVLFLADPQAVVENAEAGHVHAPGEECAFCAAHAADKADMIALVQFVDDRGKVLPVDVRELFDVKERDTVVVQGEARVTAGGILVVNAQGLYIRK
ncbi:MAG: hypothetical protein ACR2NM_12400 [Bythopirellula sp.]